MSNSDDPIEQLKQFNFRLRHQFELAEALLPAMNRQIEDFATLNLGNLVLLGNVILEQPYLPGCGPSDSAQLHQAALMIPGGLGVLRWDLEEYLELRDVPDGLETEASLRFVPLAECGAGIKGLLVSEARQLLDR